MSNITDQTSIFVVILLLISILYHLKGVKNKGTSILLTYPKVQVFHWIQKKNSILLQSQQS